MAQDEMATPVTIITGAGSGIGRSLAILLCARGQKLALAGRTLAKLNETARRCEGAEILCHQDDLSDDSAALRLVTAVIRGFGRIDTLVNCAGIAPRVPIGATTETHMRECLGVGALGPACLILKCWPHFIAQGGGRIVNVSSLASSDPFSGFFAYAASKSALDSLTRSAALEGSDVGVKAFSINLGCVETPLLRSFADEKLVPRSNAHSPEAIAAIIAEYVEGVHDGQSGKCIAIHSP